MAIRRLYTRQDGKWAWELVVDGDIVATDGGQGYDNEADAREVVNRIIGGEFADAEKRIRRPSPTGKKAPKASASESAAVKTPEKADKVREKQAAAKKAPAKKVPSKNKTAQKPGAPASTSGQYQPKRGGSDGKKAAAKKETSSSRNSKTSTRAIRGAFTTADVRAWAKRNGYAVSDRGRVPKHISGAYRAAHRS